MTTIGLDAEALAAEFDLGVLTAPAERVAHSWGGQNVLWRLTTSLGIWALREIGRDQGPDPDGALAPELAAYRGRIPMPRPIPSRVGASLATVKGRIFRCHDWVDGTALPWHGQTAAEVGGMLANLHALRLPWSPKLAPTSEAGADRWLALGRQVRAECPELGTLVDRASPAIRYLETGAATQRSSEVMVGSHRDLHPTNIMRLADKGGLVLVDRDAAGPVVPSQEVACFALVLADCDDGAGYEVDVAGGFIEGYRLCGGSYMFSGTDDLAMTIRGRLWWVEQNVRMALRPETAASQRQLAAVLLRDLEVLPSRISVMCSILQQSS